MRVKARIHGAISILNAIPTGVGGAMGIDLWAEAEVEVVPGDFFLEIEIPEDEDPKLVKCCVELVLRRAGIRDCGVRVKTRANIPIGKGLKSSSSVSDAVVYAASRAVGLSLEPLEVVNLAVDASVKAGVTITGAFDDAYTCFSGGINITDNYARKILLSHPSPEDLMIAILVPEEKIYTKNVDVKRFKKVEGECRRAIQLALSGRFWEAMIINGSAVAKAVGVDDSPAKKAIEAGANGAGVSGTGPAIAAVAPVDKIDRVLAVLEESGEVILCKPNNKRAFCSINKMGELG